MKNKIFNKNEYDEYQRGIRNKYGMNSFVLLMILILFDALINSFFKYNWAMPVVKAITLIVIVSIYFITCIALKGAFVPYNMKKSQYIGAISIGVIGFMNIFLVLRAMKFYDKGIFNSEGLLADQFAVIINGAFFIYTALIMIYSYKKYGDE